MLGAVGTNRRQARTMILAEPLILSSIGTALGLLSCLYLDYSADGFPMTYVFPDIGILMTIASGSFFGVLAVLISSRHAAGMGIAQARR